MIHTWKVTEYRVEQINNEYNQSEKKLENMLQGHIKKEKLLLAKR